MQGVWWLRARISTRFYLAVHHRSGCYPLAVQTAGVCCSLLCGYAPCSLTIFRSEYFSSSKKNFRGGVGFTFSYPHSECVYTPFLHRLPYPLCSCVYGAFVLLLFDTVCLLFNQSANTAPGFLAPPSAMISDAFCIRSCGLNLRQAIL